MVGPKEICPFPESAPIKPHPGRRNDLDSSIGAEFPAIDFKAASAGEAAFGPNPDNGPWGRPGAGEGEETDDFFGKAALPLSLMSGP